MKWHLRIEGMIPLGLLERRLFVFREDNDKKIFVAKMIFKECGVGQSFDADDGVFLVGNNSFNDNDEIANFLRAIVDFAIASGISPSQDFAGELKATREHLEDMRRIASVSDWKKP